MRNEQVVEAWYNRTCDKVDGLRHNLWFKGHLLYSYGTVIAVRLPDGRVIVREPFYSITTRRHISLVHKVVPKKMLTIATSGYMLAKLYAEYTK